MYSTAQTHGMFDLYANRLQKKLAFANLRQKLSQYIYKTY